MSEPSGTPPELSYAALGATLELSRLRSSILVGTALALKFPTEDEWWELISDPEYIESLNSLAEVINDIRADSQVVDAITPEAVAEAADKHHARALECVETVAERLGIPPEDLLSVLISA